MVARRRTSEFRGIDLSDLMGPLKSDYEKAIAPLEDDVPAGTVMVTIKLRFRGGQSERSVIMQEERLRPSVPAFFDPLKPNDSLIAYATREEKETEA